MATEAPILELQLSETRYRVRRYDGKNFVLERYTGRRWSFSGYYGVRDLTGLVKTLIALATDIPDGLSGQPLEILATVIERQAMATAAVSRQFQRLLGEEPGADDRPIAA